MSVGEGTLILLVICLVFAVAIAAYSLAKNEMLTHMYNDLVRRYNDERGVSYVRED
ncbi:hypothetical protein NHG32_02515 [Aerococcaceae bacterium NML191219]|nr:hypothetical protein [Aerococcaceae bacterium NML191219]